MTDRSIKMPFVKVKGTNQEIGYQHGSLLKDRVRECYSFYTEKLIVNPVIDLEEYGNRFLEKTRDYFPQYAVEIEALAAGAEMEPWQISILNARTEIFVKTMNTVVNECTTCFFRNERILGENWDWMIECEKLIALMEIERNDGHKILMVVEPGIIGKIGLNSAGLGVGLNILHGNEFDVGVPVHVLLRAALDAQNLNDVESIFSKTPACTFSNVLVTDESGNYLDYEFMGCKHNLVNYGRGNPIHTNHYLSESLDEKDNPMYQSSIRRMDRVTDLNSDIPGESIEKMKTILLDKENGEEAICSDFKRHFHYQVGTVSSMIMDLPRRRMWITKGSPLRNQYQLYQL